MLIKTLETEILLKQAFSSEELLKTLQAKPLSNVTFEKESCEAILLGIRPLAGSALLPCKSQRSKENVPSSFSMEKKIGHEVRNVFGVFFFLPLVDF